MGVKISQLFEVSSGDFHALKELDEGEIPLVSCGDTDNGVMGYYDVPEDKRYRRAITVAYNGSWPIMSKFHPYVFGAKDDVAVLVPHTDMSALALLYVSALLNRMTWRYSYGRKCFKEKLEGVEIPVPTITVGNELRIDESAIQRAFPKGVRQAGLEIAHGAGEWLAAI